MTNVKIQDEYTLDGIICYESQYPSNEIIMQNIDNGNMSRFWKHQQESLALCGADLPTSKIVNAVKELQNCQMEVKKAFAELEVKLTPIKERMKNTFTPIYAEAKQNMPDKAPNACHIGLNNNNGDFTYTVMQPVEKHTLLERDNENKINTQEQHKI